MSLLPYEDKYVELWLYAYRRNPRATVLATVVAVIAIATTIFVVDQKNRERQELERLQSADYGFQLQQLQQTEKSLQQLSKFVASQKSSLRETQDAVSSLKREHERLRPVLETDRKAIEAILSEQERRNSLNVWRERWIGFALGVISSLVASFLWAIAVRLRVSKA